VKKLDTSKRKALLAAGAEFLKALSDVDEVEAHSDAAKRLLEATQSELAASQAQLENSHAEFVRAQAEHAQWCEAAAKERREGNTQIDLLQQELRTLEAQVREKQAALNSILGGMAALSRRLEVG
jgi:hypothetical protein